MLAADALSTLRLVAAAFFPRALAEGGWLPVALVVLAAATDFTDGPVARRAGTASRHGALLDNVADVAFVLGGTAAGAALRLLPWAVPASIALAVAVYAIASLRLTASMGAARLARSPIGHAAGVVNYVVVAVVAGAVALPGAGWTALLAVAAVVGIAVNLAAIGERPLRALVLRAAGSRGRSDCSSA